MQTGQKDDHTGTCCKPFHETMMRLHQGAETKLHVFQRGEKAMRERAALLVENDYATRWDSAVSIRAIPLSVADGPAPAKEKGSGWCMAAKSGTCYRHAGHNGDHDFVGDPPPFPPTAEGRTPEGLCWCHRLKVCPIEERAALLACLQELRLVAWQAFHALIDIHKYGEHKDNPLPVRLRKALAAADAVVKP